MGIIQWAIAIIGAAGSVYGIMSYYSSISIRETRKIALEKFDFSSRFNDQLIADLHEYGNSQDSFRELFMQGLTLQQGIDILKRAETEVLTKENRLAITKSKSKMRLDEIIKLIDTQIKHQSEIRTHFDYFISNTK